MYTSARHIPAFKKNGVDVFSFDTIVLNPIIITWNVYTKIQTKLWGWVQGGGGLGGGTFAR